MIQCDQIGRFRKFLMTNTHAKVAQMLSEFLGFLKIPFSTKAWNCYFLGNFWKKKLGYFLIQHIVTLLMNNVGCVVYCF